MTRGELLTAAGFLVVVALYAGLSTVWTSSDPGWYDALAKPAWQPPPVVFGVMWPLNFLALTVAGIAVSIGSPPSRAWTALGVFAISVVFALGWAYLFYVPHALGPAALALASAAVITWVLVIVTWRALPWAGAVLIPYALWMSIATSLSVGYWQLARAH